MPDVFISYRRDDRPKAEDLYRALKEEGLDVWWDGGLQAGETFDEKIQKLLQTVKAVVVLWSPSAVESEWVRGEGTIGRERGVLVPVMVKSVAIPVPFNLIHTADLTHWSGDRSDPAYQGVVARIKQLASKEHVKPLKPPPDRAMLRLWQALAAVAVIAVGGASLWFFKPWDRIAAAASPEARAKSERVKNIARLAAFGIQPNDLETRDWSQIANGRLNPTSYEALKTEADTGNAPAQAVLCAAAYWGATGRDSDYDLALKTCRLSAEAGEPAGQVYYGTLLSERADLASDEQQKRTAQEAAAAEFKKAADQGFGWGQLSYGARLEEGAGVVRDPAQAFELYKAAQAQGLAAGDYAVGTALMHGLDSPPDAAEGLKLIQVAADKGYAPALYEMASVYRDGRGAPEDLEKSLEYFRKAAQQKDNQRLAERAKSSVEYVERLIEQKRQEAAKPAPAPAPN